MSERAWFFTVIRSDGLHFMHPTKPWRPIVTLEVDGHHCRETVLGSDGQNPNAKEQLCFEEAHVNSTVDIKVWHRSQSKKKKKRSLVACATHSVGELLKKQEPKTPVQVRLSCQSSAKRTQPNRGRPQNGAVIHIRICPPASHYSSDLDTKTESDNETCVSSEPPPSPVDSVPDRIIIRDDTEIQPFSIYSDDEEDSPSFMNEKPFLEPPPPTSSYYNPVSWIAASLLPQYTEKVEVPKMSLPERMLSSFTVYAELKNAVLESQYDDIFRRLQMEWTYVGGLLVALAAVDTAVFAIGTDSVFIVDSWARSAIATSSIASGLGIACDAWFLLRYSWADVQTFISRAKDLYGSYFFFSLSARTPALCMFFSALSLMMFMGLVAFDVWPTGVLVTCFFIGFLMTLQFLVYGIHQLGRKVAQGGRGSVRLIRRMTG